MARIKITDLAVDEQLDAQALATVRGGVSSNPASFASSFNIGRGGFALTDNTLGIRGGGFSGFSGFASNSFGQQSQ